MDIRKIRFRVSGGFAGLVRGTELEASELSSAERSALARAVKTSNAARSPDARDAQIYELEVVSASGTHHLEFDETQEPDGLGDLVQRLMQRARPVTP